MLQALWHSVLRAPPLFITYNKMRIHITVEALSSLGGSWSHIMQFITRTKHIKNKIRQHFILIKSFESKTPPPKNQKQKYVWSCVYWTVHHCESWRIKDQLDVTCRLQASACNTDTTPTQPHRNSNTHRTKNYTTNVVIQQNSRKLLMMDILMSETCWAHKR